MRYMKENKINNGLFQKGAVSIVLAVLLLSILLVIGLGISALMLQQIKLSGQSGRSVIAFYAADAGAERCLYDVRKGTGFCPFGDVFLDIPSTKYNVDYNGVDLIESTGTYRTTVRKLQVGW